MKKLLLSSIILFSVLSTCQIAQAQCTPDTTIKSTGIYPAAFERAQEEKPFSQVIQYFITKDTAVTYQGFPITATIDSLVITSVKGLPSGFSYSCHNSNCLAKGGESGCATISGTPAAGSKGSYPLTVYYDIYAHAVLFGTPIGQSMKDSTTRYTLYVDGATGLSSISPNAFRVYPNPAKGGFTISNLTSEQIQLFNALGQEFTLSAESTTASGSYFNTGNLPKGFYFIRANNKLGEKILIE
ncbi:MAG: T9SS type A sorting domain-containing protein [Bacteroidetes bacterium]|nr:T9SS type A sorting domain-containing protein [Bacteroidota bacterium]